MGTHAAFAVTYADGRHECVEKTMGGDELMHRVGVALIKLGRPSEPLLPFLERELRAPTWGVGKGERGADREHEPEYYIHINYAEKYVGLCGVETIKPVLLARILWRLTSLGWDIRWESDCPPESPCYTTEMSESRSADDEASWAPHDGSQEEFLRELYKRLDEEADREG